MLSKNINIVIIITVYNNYFLLYFRILLIPLMGKLHIIMLICWFVAQEADFLLRCKSLLSLLISLINASLLNKSIIKKENLTDPKLLNGSVIISSYIKLHEN